MRLPISRMSLLVIPVCLACAASVARADIITIDPFEGMAEDTFDQYNQNMAEQSLPVFGNLGAIQNLSQGGAIKVEWGSQFQGKWVRAISGMMVGQLGVGQWIFDVPVTRFGGWWENNSGADDATVEFFDAGDNLLGVQIADIPFRESGWRWNGWESDVPIHRIVVTGNGVLNGFLWYENMQIDYIPAPGAAVLLLAAGCIGARRRSR